MTVQILQPTTGNLPGVVVTGNRWEPQTLTSEPAPPSLRKVFEATLPQLGVDFIRTSFALCVAPTHINGIFTPPFTNRASNRPFSPESLRVTFLIATIISVTFFIFNFVYTLYKGVHELTGKIRPEHMLPLELNDDAVKIPKGLTLNKNSSDPNKKPELIDELIEWLPESPAIKALRQEVINDEELSGKSSPYRYTPQGLEINLDSLDPIDRQSAIENEDYRTAYQHYIQFGKYVGLAGTLVSEPSSVTDPDFGGCVLPQSGANERDRVFTFYKYYLTKIITHIYKREARIGTPLADNKEELNQFYERFERKMLIIFLSLGKANNPESKLDLKSRVELAQQRLNIARELSLVQRLCSTRHVAVLLQQVALVKVSQFPLIPLEKEKADTRAKEIEVRRSKLTNLQLQLFQALYKHRYAAFQAFPTWLITKGKRPSRYERRGWGTHFDLAVHTALAPYAGIDDYDIPENLEPLTTIEAEEAIKDFFTYCYSCHTICELSRDFAAGIGLSESTQDLPDLISAFFTENAGIWLKEECEMLLKQLTSIPSLVPKPSDIGTPPQNDLYRIGVALFNRLMEASRQDPEGQAPANEQDTPYADMESLKHSKVFKEIKVETLRPTLYARGVGRDGRGRVAMTDGVAILFNRQIKFKPNPVLLKKEMEQVMLDACHDFTAIDERIYQDQPDLTGYALRAKRIEALKKERLDPKINDGMTETLSKAKLEAERLKELKKRYESQALDRMIPAVVKCAAIDLISKSPQNPRVSPSVLVTYLIEKNLELDAQTQQSLREASIEENPALDEIALKKTISEKARVLYRTQMELQPDDPTKAVRIQEDLERFIEFLSKKIEAAQGGKNPYPCTALRDRLEAEFIKERGAGATQVTTPSTPSDFLDTLRTLKGSYPPEEERSICFQRVAEQSVVKKISRKWRELTINSQREGRATLIADSFVCPTREILLEKTEHLDWENCPQQIEDQIKLNIAKHIEAQRKVQFDLRLYERSIGGELNYYMEGNPNPITGSHIEGISELTNGKPLKTRYCRAAIYWMMERLGICEGPHLRDLPTA